MFSIMYNFSQKLLEKFYLAVGPIGPVANLGAGALLVDTLSQCIHPFGTIVRHPCLPDAL